MVTWGNLVHYIDGATGDRIAQKMIPGSPEHEAFWGPFLADFEKHVKAKGWLGNVYIAIDERSREELMASANVLKKYAPGLKIQMAGNNPPSSFKGIEVHNYSQGMRMGFITPEFKAEVKERRAKGYVTTTYICCNPAKPTTTRSWKIRRTFFADAFMIACWPIVTCPSPHIAVFRFRFTARIVVPCNSISL